MGGKGKGPMEGKISKTVPRIAVGETNQIVGPFRYSSSYYVH